MSSKVIVAFFSLPFFTTTTALATVVFTEPPDPAGGQIKSAWYAPDGMDGDQWAWDNFKLGSAQSFNEISWRGAYTNYLSGAGRAPVYDFTISIYANVDTAGEPDVTHAPIVKYQTGDNAAETLAGTFGGVQMYDYRFTMPAAFQAAANTTYWLQIEASQGLTPQYFWPPDWSIGWAVPGVGDGSHFQAINGSTKGTTYHWYPRDLAFTLASVVPVVNASWKNDENGDWSSGGNWNNNIAPNGIDHTATLGPVITQPRTITMNSGATVATINFNSIVTYAINGNGTLTLDSTTQAGVNVQAGSHTISAPLMLNRDAVIDVGPFQSTLSLTGQVYANARTITKNGSGALEMTNIRAGGLTISDGWVNVRPNGTNNGTSRIGVLDIGTWQWLDLNDNDLIVTQSDYATINALLLLGRDGGLWDGFGITSTVAANSIPSDRTLGVLSGDQYLSVSGALFDGFAIAPTDVLVKFTYYGDADFNGFVNFDDYARIDSGFNNGGTTWFEGDFDLNGVVNFDDYALIDLAFNTQAGALSGAGSPIPEPSICVTAAIAALLYRRRTRQ